MNIAVLGDGITAKAVCAFLERSEDYHFSTIDDADFIVTSPGIPPDKFPLIDVEIISDIDFAYYVLESRSLS